MATQETGGYCNHCDQKVMVRRKGTSHVLHLILAIVTLGVWIPIWLLTSVKVGGWRCAICGSEASTGSSAGMDWSGIVIVAIIAFAIIWMMSK